MSISRIIPNSRFSISLLVIWLLSMFVVEGQTMWMMVHEEEKVASTSLKTREIVESKKITKPTEVYNKGWREEITATIFWVGEKACKANPVHNKSSSWDVNWVKRYGGVDTPYKRKGFNPKYFRPKMNPFYIALPYNDISSRDTKHKEGVSKMIWWYDKAYKSKYLSVCKGKWLAIKYGDKICYAQWEDCGPFLTTDAAYVFQGKRPKKNRNNSAGIDLSPAIRDYLGLKSGEKVSWRFVDEYEVNDGPWSKWLKESRLLSKNP